MSNIDKQAVQAVADLKAGYTLGHADVAILNELARIALASLEARSRKLFTCSACGAEGLDEPLESKCHCNEDGAHWIESVVYTAPPALMLPEEMPKGLAGQIVSLLAHNVGDKLLAKKIWNACRDAMLQGAELVKAANKLPDGWVACSERMPEDGSKVIVFRPRANESNDPPVKIATYKGGREYYHGFDCYCDPTHWMPLPSPPAK